MKYRPGYVYFVGTADGQLVKVGISETPMKRFDDLKRGAMVDLVFLAFAPGTKEDEKRIHKVFDACRSRHEWFVRTYELNALITHVKECATIPTCLSVSETACSTVGKRYQSHSVANFIKRQEAAA